MIPFSGPIAAGAERCRLSRQQVEVRVLEIDCARKRLSLPMKPQG
jgi:hypothetical protein